MHSIAYLENGNAFYAHLLQSSQWYVYLLIVNGIISAALFPLVIFLILRKSPQEMSSCIKKMIFNSNLTALAIALLMAIWLPVPLHPVLGGFSLGAFRWIGGSILNRIIFAIWFILLMNLSVNYLFAFLHYYALLTPTLALNRFNRVSMQFCTFYLALIGLFFCLITSMNIMGIDSPEELLEYAFTFPQNHFVRVIVAMEPSTMGENISSGNLLSLIIFAVLCVFVTFQLVAIGVLNCGILLNIRKTRNIVQSNTLCLQVTAYLRLFLAKSILLLIFYFIPFLIITLSFFGIFNTILPQQLIAYLFFAFHSPILMLQTIILIRPYREWTFNTVSRIKMRLNSAKTRLTMTTTRIMPTEFRQKSSNVEMNKRKHKWTKLKK